MAAYDAAGDVTCRAATSANSCAGNSPNGAPLTWDTEGRLVEWTSPTGAPWASSIDLYDGEGNRVQQQTVAGGVTTQTYYIGNLEEVSVAGGVTTTTTYYYAGNGGPRIATATNGVFSYLASDTLGTAEVALDANGNTTAAQLYAPYGTTRYASGTMPGSYGYTGQHADAVTGLDYYGARYYDAVAGVFASADTVLPGKGYDVWGLSRYAYVEGNPITRNDPSGHCWPLCAIAAAFVVGVVAFGVDVAVQAIANGGNLSKVNYGTAAAMGVGAAVLTGAVLLTGGAALAAEGGAAAAAGAAAEGGAAVAAEGGAAVAAEAGGAAAADAGAAAVADGGAAAAEAGAGTAAEDAAGLTAADRGRRFVSGFIGGITPHVVRGVFDGQWDVRQMLIDGVTSGAVAALTPGDIRPSLVGLGVSLAIEGARRAVDRHVTPLRPEPVPVPVPGPGGDSGGTWSSHGETFS